MDNRLRFISVSNMGGIILKTYVYLIYYDFNIIILKAGRLIL